MPFLAELRRVQTQDGTLFALDANPLNPLTVHAVNTCEFDERAALIRVGAPRRRVRAAGFRGMSVVFRIFLPGALHALLPVGTFARLPAAMRPISTGCAMTMSVSILMVSVCAPVIGQKMPTAPCAQLDKVASVTLNLSAKRSQMKR